ncbi:LacI family DNA-binding transcriptional regulator [Piscinibacter sp. HJYY11]|uniref:LacI family DNA-binding transcriptional regulator n=1 Tax=Piscinibacter sp. HJYY11 TaxID=2801333 RepID=UPI00191FB958|nr:LacI family DNA-binding transcriptional regulator [Piscinibacter sp. HJYY11]MBL0729613.1 LacI family DNA-binding transcriptional regulator [Piscinibacter sp. HJYY11]
MARHEADAGKNLTILDVAREAKVSKSTVSLVLQGSNLIRENTAQKVRDAVEKLGYVYNRRAAELRGQSSNTIGVVINDLMNPFFAEVLVGIERKLVDAGYIVLMANTHESLSRQEKVLASMREHKTAGIILCPALGTSKTVPELVQSWGIPLLVMARSLGRGSYDYAGSDNERGVKMAVDYLLSKGHKKIGFLGGRPGVVYDQRLRGYDKALAAAGINVNEKFIVESAPNRAGGYEAMKIMLAMRTRPTAAVCYNDITALGALAALGDEGMRAGRDFALLGFDNVIDTAHSNPPLSTIDVRPAEIGEHAAAALMARIADPSIARQVYVAQPRLLLRQSA